MYEDSFNFQQVRPVITTNIMFTFTSFLLLTYAVALASCRNDYIPRTEASRSKNNLGINLNFQIKPSLTDIAIQVRGGNKSRTRSLTTEKAVVFGSLLAFNSGVINGVCLSGLLQPTKQASAAVTGAWTNSALGVATGNYEQFLFNGKCILSYFFGSFISGLINYNPTPFEISVGTFRSMFWIGSALLFGSSWMCGSAEEGKGFIFLAAMANGLQNSLTSSTTANLVRSAHFSGITSDIGTFFGQCIRGNQQNLGKLKVFIKLAISFWVGGFSSYFLVEKFGSQTLLFSSVLYMILGVGVGFV